MADVVNGGSGTDTLNIIVSGGGTTVANATVLPAATLTSIEAVSVRNTATGSTTAALNDHGVSFTSAAGITTLTNDRSTDFVAFTSVANGATINVKGSGSTTTAQGATSATFATGATTATVNFQDGTGTSGANNSGDVTIGSGLTSLTIGSTGAANAAGTVTTSAGTTTTGVTINADTNLTLAALTGYSAASASTLTVNGAGAVTVTGALDATLDTINAAGNSGGVSVTLGAGTTAFTGGTGNDTVNAGALAVTSALNGGDGTGDRIIFTASTNYATAATKVSNFETLAVRSAAGGDAYDMSLISGITALQVESAGTTTFNNVGATTPITVTNNVTTSLAVNLASTTGTNEVNVTIDDRDTTAAAITVGAINVGAGVETLNIVSNDALTAGTPHVVSALTGSTGLTTVKVTGTSDLTITDATAPSGALTIDGSGMTTRLTVGATTGTGISAGDTVKGGSAADNLFIAFGSLGTTTSFQAGSGDDTLTVTGNGSDVVDGDFAAITGVDNLVIESATTASVTLQGYAQSAIGTVDANADGRLDITAAGLTTGGTINAGDLTTKGVDIAATLTVGAAVDGTATLALTGGAIADTISVTTSDANDDGDDVITANITGGNGIDVITIAVTEGGGGGATNINVISTATSLANSEIVTGFEADTDATSAYDYNGTLQDTVAGNITSNAVLNTAFGTVGDAVYILSTDIANASGNTQGSAFAAVLGSNATTLATNYAALEAQLLATNGSLNGTFSNLDAAIANGNSALIVLDNGTGSAVLRITNSTTTANTITADEIDLVGVFTNHVLVAGDFA